MSKIVDHFGIFGPKWWTIMDTLGPWGIFHTPLAMGLEPLYRRVKKFVTTYLFCLQINYSEFRRTVIDRIVQENIFPPNVNDPHLMVLGVHLHALGELKH